MKTQNKMKNNFFLLLLFLTFSKPLFSQNDSIFPNEYGTWVFQPFGYDIDPVNYDIGEYRIRKIDPNYDTMTMYSLVYDNNGNVTELHFATLYTDSLKVYSKKGHQAQFFDFYVSYNENVNDNYEVLYDFSLNVGDTAYIFFGNDVIVYQIDTIYINGEIRKKFYLTPGDDIWIQGLGSIRHPIFPKIKYCWECLPTICKAKMQYDGPSTVDDYEYNSQPYLCHYASIEENKLNNLNIYPNPLTSDILTLEIEKSFIIEEIKIYDVFLQKILFKPVKFKPGQLAYQIDLSEISSGYYVIELNSKQKKVRQQFVKF
jgi:hypothetical protein